MFTRKNISIVLFILVISVGANVFATSCDAEPWKTTCQLVGGSLASGVGVTYFVVRALSGNGDNTPGTLGFVFWGSVAYVLPNSTAVYYIGKVFDNAEHGTYSGTLGGTLVGATVAAGIVYFAYKYLGDRWWHYYIVTVPACILLVPTIGSVVGYNLSKSSQRGMPAPMIQAANGITQRVDLVKLRF